MSARHIVRRAYHAVEKLFNGRRRLRELRRTRRALERVANATERAARAAEGILAREALEHAADYADEKNGNSGDGETERPVTTNKDRERQQRSVSRTSLPTRLDLDPEDLLTADEVEAEFGISRRQLARWRKTYGLPAYGNRAGRRYRRGDLYDLLKRLGSE